VEGTPEWKALIARLHGTPRDARATRRRSHDRGADRAGGAEESAGVRARLQRWPRERPTNPARLDPVGEVDPGQAAPRARAPRAHARRATDLQFGADLARLLHEAGRDDDADARIAQWFEQAPDNEQAIGS